MASKIKKFGDGGVNAGSHAGSAPNPGQKAGSGGSSGFQMGPIKYPFPVGNNASIKFTGNLRNPGIQYIKKFSGADGKSQVKSKEDGSSDYPYELPESTISSMPGGKEMQTREAARLQRKKEDEGAKQAARDKLRQQNRDAYDRWKQNKKNEGQEEKDTLKDVGSAVVSGVKSLGSKAADVAEKVGAASKDLGSKLYNKVTGKKEESKEFEETEEPEKPEGMKKGGKVGKKNWIAGAIKKPGALRQSLGVKKGEKIPAKKLASAAKKPGKMGQRARLAQTLKGFSTGGVSRGDGCAQRGKTRGKYV